MTTSEIALWRDIAAAIKPYCTDGAEFIYSRCDLDIPGFFMENHNPGILTIGVIGSHINIMDVRIQDDNRFTR